MFHLTGRKNKPRFSSALTLNCETLEGIAKRLGAQASRLRNIAKINKAHNVYYLPITSFQKLPIRWFTAEGAINRAPTRRRAAVAVIICSSERITLLSAGETPALPGVLQFHPCLIVIFSFRERPEATF